MWRQGAWALGALVVTLVLRHYAPAAKARPQPRPSGPVPPVAAGQWRQQPEALWRRRLTAEAYSVLRQAGTERPFSSPYAHATTPGVYRCAGCDFPLFSSKTQFDSGTGWPSFWAPLADSQVDTHTDVTLGLTRTEVRCRQCGGHLGHVFDDGPPPTGKRFCINGVSLRLAPR
jgi:peptide-methionine (R)-S-oxide reductase